MNTRCGGIVSGIATGVMVARETMRVMSKISEFSDIHGAHGSFRGKQRRKAGFQSDAYYHS